MIIENGVLREVKEIDIINGKFNIPEGVTEIGEFAFSGCSSLGEISIPEGVTEIGAYAFEGCSSLSEISIPEGVTKIGKEAFKGCSKELQIKALKQNIKVLNGIEEDGIIRNDLSFLKQLGAPVEQYAGSILREVIANGLEETYQKLEGLENEVKENQKERIGKLIWIAKQRINIRGNLKEEIEKEIKSIQSWIDKNLYHQKNYF